MSQARFAFAGSPSEAIFYYQNRTIDLEIEEEEEEPILLPKTTDKRTAPDNLSQMHLRHRRTESRSKNERQQESDTMVLCNRKVSSRSHRVCPSSLALSTSDYRLGAAHSRIVADFTSAGLEGS